MQKKGVCDNDKNMKKSKKAKQLKASDMILDKPSRFSKCTNSRRSWVHLNDDDSMYLPSVHTENCSEKNNTNLTIIVMRMLLDSEVVKEAIEELGKSISSISLPTSKLTFKELYTKQYETRNVSKTNSGGKQIT